MLAQAEVWTMQHQRKGTKAVCSRDSCKAIRKAGRRQLPDSERQIGGRSKAAVRQLKATEAGGRQLKDNQKAGGRQLKDIQKAGRRQRKDS